MRRYVRRSVRWVGQLLDDMNTKNTGVLAAGAAYFAVLAFFPLVAAAVAIAALIIGPGHVDVVTAGLGHYVPRDIASLLTTQIELASNQPNGSIAVAVVAIILAIFWASGFIENLARALGAVYGLRETRHPLRIKARSMGLTVLALGLVYVLVGLLMLHTGALVESGVPAAIVPVILAARWLGVIGVMLLAVVGLYQFGPNHAKRPKLFGWGVVSATGLWLLATVVFVLYARYWAHFGATYSLFAGVIALMLWCNLSATALLVGAHVDVLSRARTKR